MSQIDRIRKLHRKVTQMQRIASRRRLMFVFYYSKNNKICEFVIVYYLLPMACSAKDANEPFKRMICQLIKDIISSQQFTRCRQTRTKSNTFNIFKKTNQNNNIKQTKRDYRRA